MATEPQPPQVVEGATTGDIEDEIPLAKSAEDRKAAAAMSSLDAKGEDEGNAKNVDQEAVRAAMERLSVGNKVVEKKVEVKQEVRKVVKLDAADVTLVVSVLGGCGIGTGIC
jgi:hypothetical protein